MWCQQCEIVSFQTLLCSCLSTRSICQVALASRKKLERGFYRDDTLYAPSRFLFLLSDALLEGPAELWADGTAHTGGRVWEEDTVKRLPATKRKTLGKMTPIPLPLHHSQPHNWLSPSPRQWCSPDMNMAEFCFCSFVIALVC